MKKSQTYWVIGLSKLLTSLKVLEVTKDIVELYVQTL